MIEDLLGADLLKGERIVWSGRPDPRRVFTRADLLLVPFSLLWGGFALLWEVSVLGLGPFGSQPAPVFFALWGVPFVLAGLYFVVGRFLYKAWSKRHTLYALTTQRVIALHTGRGRSLRALFLDTLPAIGVSSEPDGRGTLVFGTPTVLEALYGNTGLDLFGRGSAVTFYDVPDAPAVAGIIQKLRRAERA